MTQYRNHQVKAFFNKAAMSYNKVAVLQREIGDRLLERFELINVRPEQIADLGAGTGYCTTLLFKRYSCAKLTVVDLAEAMLGEAHKVVPQKAEFVCADVSNLPFEANRFDLIFSNLMLHWCDDLQVALGEIKRVLKPNGLFLFSMLGSDTLSELKNSWAKADDHVLVHDFVTIQNIGDSLIKLGFKDPVLDTEKLSVTYEQVKTLMRDLKMLGVHNLSRGLTDKKAFQAFLNVYKACRNDGGLLPATYEVIYGHAWGALINEYLGEGEISIPLNQVRRSTT